MKILEITSKLPWPPTDGARIVMEQGARELAARGHDIHIVAVGESSPGATPLEEIAQVHAVEGRRIPRLLGVAVSLTTTAPYTQWKRDRRCVYDQLDRLEAEVGFDVVLVEEIHVAQYGAYMKRRHGLPFVLRSHNVEFEVYDRHADTVANPLVRAFIRMQGGRWRRFELPHYAEADEVIAITERDAASIAAHVPTARVSTVPAAVDLERFAYVGEEGRDAASLVMSGHLAWAPNADAAMWVADDVLPSIRSRVPEVVLYLIGAEPPRDRLPADSEWFRIEGHVASIAPFYTRSTLGLIPLRAGGGMRVKLIEMMAAGLPVVSTSLGAEGNPAEPGVHYVRADTAPDFADAVVRLLQHPDERRAMAERARRFVAETFSQDRIGRRLEERLVDVVARCSRRNEPQRRQGSR